MHSLLDLSARFVPQQDYEQLWQKRCMEMLDFSS
jgi:hypothetical protein